MNIYNDDCFNIFPKIKDKSIDLFVLDLPYANKKFGNCTNCNWDTPIDLKNMWKEIKRIMKSNAIIVHFCNTRFGFTLIQSNPKWFKYDLIWKKSKKAGFLNANKQPLRQHENIYIFANDKKEMKDLEEKAQQSTYNPQKTEGKPYTTKAHEEVGIYGNKKITDVINKGDRHPTSIVEFNSPHKTIHRTQKPVDLLEWLIKTYSNENDTVMDFCMGSGSCGVACQNTKRKFIGVEKDKEIFEKAKIRLIKK